MGGYWQLFAFACACLGALTAFSYALRPFITSRSKSWPANEDAGTSISAGELEELIGRAVEAANAPLHARLDVLEEELRAAGHSIEGGRKRQLSRGKTVG